MHIFIHLQKAPSVLRDHLTCLWTPFTNAETADQHKFVLRHLWGQFQESGRHKYNETNTLCVEPEYSLSLCVCVCVCVCVRKFWVKFWFRSIWLEWLFYIIVCKHYWHLNNNSSNNNYYYHKHNNINTKQLL